MGGKLDEAMGLIEEGVDVESRRESGMTNLIFAARSGRVEIIQLLLDNGANVNHKDNYGKTAIHGAASKGHDGAVKLLIGRGANLHIKSINTTPLDSAKLGENKSTIAIIETAIKSTKGKNE